MYKERFGDRHQPHHTMFGRLMKMMDTEGKFVKNKSRRCNVTNDDNSTLILASLYANPHTSLRSVAGKIIK